jgi:glutathione S-transferase
MIEVLEHPLSLYAQKVKIALAEKGVPFTVRTPQAIGSDATPPAPALSRPACSSASTAITAWKG